MTAISTFDVFVRNANGTTLTAVKVDGPTFEQALVAVLTAPPSGVAMSGCIGYHATIAQYPGRVANSSLVAQSLLTSDLCTRDAKGVLLVAWAIPPAKADKATKAIHDVLFVMAREDAPRATVMDIFRNNAIAGLTKAQGKPRAQLQARAVATANTATASGANEALTSTATASGANKAPRK